MAAESERIVAVFDCMVFLQGAARRESPAGVCLALAERGLVDLYVSPEILAELEDVLLRPKVRWKFPTLRDEVVAEFIAAVREMATVVEDAPRDLVLERDPKDEPYLNLACQADADYLVTRDTDLLDLMHETEGIGAVLKQRYSRLRIVDPVAFLRSLRG